MENTEKQLSLFWRKLSRMISSGVPLIKTLEVLTREITDQRLRVVIEQIIADLNSGEILSDSLENHPFFFPPSIHAIVKSGETLGRLDIVTEDIAKGFEDGTFILGEDIRDAADRGKVTEPAGKKKLPAEEHTDHIIREALKMRASDIHLEWVANRLRIRYRIDGVLEEIKHDIPEDQQNSIVSAVKHLSALNIAEKKIPQDSRVLIEVEGKTIDLRVAVTPYAGGESAVISFLNRVVSMPDIDNQGLTRDNLLTLRKWIRKPNGLIMVAGPSGSGKTTTLLSLIRELNSIRVKIITVEDPIECKIDGVNQFQIDPRIGLTCAHAIRCQMRQDPDIIMIGEINEPETAHLMVQAALTGHLVLTQLHTNGAAETIWRLINMGVEPFLVNSTPICVISQRIVRIICEKCKEEYKPESWVMDSVRIPEKTQFFRGKGCDNCNQSGYKGRIGIHELLEVDDAMRRLIVHDVNPDELRKQAIESGMITLVEDGIEKVGRSLTTIDEVIRVCADTTIA